MQSQNNVINPVAKQSLVERITIETKGHDGLNGSSDSSLDDRAHGAPQVIGEEPGTSVSDGPAGKRMFAFLKSRNFWIVLALSQTITLCQTVLGYRYTTILSAQLLSYWTIVVVVILSFAFLKVRYHIAQYAGILVCCAGFGVLIASDHVTGSNSTPGSNPTKGALFVLLSATLYGFTNVFEEFLVSKRPMYEVLGQLAFYGMIINGAQAGIFDRSAFRSATWNSQVAGYLVGFTLLLFTFYSLAPIVFRMSSAAFFNIGLLTGSFWGVAIGVKVFGYSIHWMYPIAFVLIILGHFVYYGTEGVLGDAKKPWLGENQEGGVAGVGTARRRIENPDVIV
ncbi:putative solute carrier family 35 member [Elsinoe australis]|uniref:Putative solute carrier family 35 member n=1 Tax=Elsinoe australis TaxID=40998 RepID=A0A4U7B538_9PEZI|nr:putative solute carrier family 35 member [Elsinoe australis]